MKINSPNSHSNFKGLYNNKAVLKGLELVSDHSASFIAATSFACAVGLRPLMINLTPKTDKENKKMFSAESISSAVTKLLVTEAVALPIEGAIKKINSNPKQFLKDETLKNLKSKDLGFLSQMVKLSSNFISAIPKSVLSVALIPVISNFLFPDKKENITTKETMLNDNLLSKNSAFLGFKGIKDIPVDFVSKVMNSECAQQFSKKHSYNDKNIAKNMSVATDILLTLGSVIGVKKSNKIQDERKKPLIANKIFSSTASILLGCKLDDLAQKGTKNIVEKFSNANKNNPKLSKYISGINVLRPTLIFAFVYYGVLPVVTTFVADKMTTNKE